MTMAPPTEVQDNAGLPEHDVAVVVFARVRAVDTADARNIAECAVANAVRDAQQVHYGSNSEPYGVLTLRRLTRTQNLRIPVEVVEVRELGFACGDTYLRVEPTGKAYRRSSERREREEAQ